MKISTVSDFLTCLGKNEGSGYEDCLYRGQADSAWRVDCSAVRRLSARGGVEIQPQAIGHALVGYLSQLLDHGSRYIGTCPELPPSSTTLDLLTQLQHQGAATGLIDFTLDPLVALWFACAEYPEEDGAVYVLSRSKTQAIDEAEVRRRGLLSYFHRAGTRDWTDHPYLWSPKATHGRPASQQSVFILGVPFVWPYLLQKAVVEKGAKDKLLSELRTEHNLSEESLFADLSGYAQANSTVKPFDAALTVEFWSERLSRANEPVETADAHLDCGMAYSAISHHERAIKQYTKAIAMDPTGIGGYVNRALERRFLGDPAGALADYDAAIENFPENMGDVDTSRFGRVYRDRGRTHYDLGHEEQFRADMDRALQLGCHFFYNEKGERGPRLDAIPEQMEEYKLLTGDSEPE